MNIDLTYNGIKQTIKNVSIGGYIIVTYYQSDGTKMEYKLILTKNETLVVNK